MREYRDPFGSILGILIFLAGVGLLGLTFWIAYGLFKVPPAETLGVKPNTPLNVNEAGRSLMQMLFRMFMLLVMCIVGSVIANRGIKLYSAGIVRVQVQEVSEG